MGYRLIYDENGNEIGKRSVVFDSISDDYEIQSFIRMPSGKHYVSQMAAINAMYQKNILSEDEYNCASLGDMSLQYVVSAEALRKQFHADIKYKNSKPYSFNPNYFIPCAYLCRHCVELKLKEMIYRLSLDSRVVKTHDIQKLWDDLTVICTNPLLNNISAFIPMMVDLDDDGMKLRYGFDNQKHPYDMKSYYFDIDILADNTEYFYDIADRIIRE